MKKLGLLEVPPSSLLSLHLQNTPFPNEPGTQAIYSVKPGTRCNHANGANCRMVMGRLAPNRLAPGHMGHRTTRFGKKGLEPLQLFNSPRAPVMVTWQKGIRPGVPNRCTNARAYML
jgi:hypothetical protein